MKVYFFILPHIVLGFFSWGRKEKVKTEILSDKKECDRKTRNGDQLFVHFWGRKEIDGAVFQTSWTNQFANDPIQVYNKPYRFQLGLGEVIDGWDMGLIDMCIGEKRRLFIPAHLAYGAQGGGTVESPGGNVIFDIELVHAEQGPRHPEVFDMMDTGYLPLFYY